jgi:hypothetical protein
MRTEIAVAASETSIDSRRAVEAPTPDSDSPSRLQGAQSLGGPKPNVASVAWPAGPTT